MDLKRSVLRSFLQHCSIALLLLFSSTASAQAPDLTAGGVPSDTTNINLGPTGMEGWIFNDGPGSLNETVDARQILVTKVDSGSPADGILAANDVILGADGTGAIPVNFIFDARKSLAYAINDAEGYNPAELKLIRWRSGVTSTVSITLEYLGGSYTATAPYNCPKSAAILEKGINHIMNNVTTTGYGGFGPTVLMAANDPSNPANATRQARVQAEAYQLNLTQADIDDMTSGDLSRSIGKPWSIGPQLITQAEYYLQTADSAVLPSIRARAIQIANAQSLFGTMGHHYSLPGPNGEVNSPYGIGYGPVNNAGMPCFLGLILAEKCGLADSEIIAGIDRAAKYFAYYADLGTVPYGENKETGSISNNGKSALAAVTLGMVSGRESEAKYFSKLSTYGAYERDSGHTGPYFNHLWTPLGSNLGGQDSLARYFSRTSWLYDLARRWDGSFVYHPYYQSGGISSSWGQGHDASWTTLLTYAVPLAQLHITGKNVNPALQMDATDLAAIDHAFDYDATTRTINELIDDLKSPFPQLHWSAGSEIGANRASDHAAILPTLQNMATNGATFAEQHGAIFALWKIADDSSAPVLSALLASSNSKVRYMAAHALKNHSMTAKTAEVTTIVNALIATDRPTLPLDPQNPLHVDTQAIGQLLFDSTLGIWGGGRVAGADRNLLYPAFRIVATSPMGGTRDQALSIYADLTKQDVENLADVMVEVAITQPPGEIMYQHRADAIGAMQAHDYAEGVPAGVIAFESMTKVGPQKNILTAMAGYGGSNLKVAPDPSIIEFLEALISNSDDFDVEAQAVIDAINGDPLPAEIVPFKSIDWVFSDKAPLTLPNDRTMLRLHSTDHAKGVSSYTWRKVHGAGEVSFAPNGTGAAKDTLAVFDGTPGVYTFEVTMSDTRGLTETSKTVTVTLNDTGGTLPSNTAPSAMAQATTVAQGTPTQVILTGSDPEGLELNFTVTSDPSHGLLSGTAPFLVYTANANYTGADSFTFEVMDSEGQVASATVSITVDPAGAIGTAVYEPFDYPNGLFHGAASATEIGLDGSWDANSGMNIIGGSLDHGYLLTKGGSIGNLSTAATYGGSRAINPAALAGNGLLADGATVWISSVIGHSGSYYNDKLFLALANDQFSTSGNTYSINNNGAQVGSGVGITMNSSQLLASHFRDASFGGTTYSHVYGTWDSYIGGMPSYDHRLVVAKITWGATQDTIEVYLPKEDLVLPATPSSVLTVNVDQSTFDTLTFSRSGSPVLDEIRIGASYHSVLQGSVAMSVDAVAPTPNPMSFVVAPTPSGPATITMTAATAYDLLEVEYYFSCTAGGGNDSGWQASPVYTDSGLTPSVQYSYTVKARDKQPGLNETTTSAEASATIPALGTVPNVVGALQASAESLVVSAGFSVGTITNATAYSTAVPAGHVLSQTPVATTSAAYGAAVDLEISIGQDPALPTLAAVDIVDDQAGGPTVVNTLVTYTLTFNEDMDAATADAADFVNAGDAAISIGVITETSPGVFTVKVTPTTTGLLRFAVAEGAALLDAQGDALNTTAATIDDTVITVNLPDEIVPNVVGLAQATAEANITAANLVVGTIRQIYDEVVPVGDVYSQDPVGGSSLPGQYPVNLVISAGPPPDTTGPVMTSIDPVDGTYNVEVNAPLVMTFDENVFVNTGSIIISNLNNGSDMTIPVTDAAQVSTYLNMLIIDPALDLVAGNSYAVRMAAGIVQDASGNDFAGINDNSTWNFSTSLTQLESVLFTEDFEAPDVVAYTQGTAPANWVKATQGFGASSHGLTDKAGGDFSAADPNHQAYAFRYGNSGITTVEGVLATLAEGGTYEVSFDVVRDDGKGAGTPYTARMIAFNPGDARNDARSSAPGIELTSTTGNARSDGFFSSVTFQYTVAAGDPAIGMDLALRFIGQSTSAIIDNVQVKTVSPFAADQVAPAIASLIPADDSSLVALTDNLQVVFDEDVAIGAGFIALKDLTTGAKTVINIIDGVQVLINGSILEINPTNDLNTNTFYSVRIDPGAISDLSGNGFAGISDDTSWSFNTGETNDVTAPSVLALSPANGATDVSYSASLSLTFDENVVVNSGTITLKNLTDATNMVIDVTDASQVVAAGSNVLITPASYMGEGKDYAVQIDAAAILDLSGNAYAGIADDLTWSFTTSANNPPEIASLDPADEAVNVDIAASLSVTFDEAVATGTGNIIIRNVNTASDLLIDVNDGTQVWISGSVLTINPVADLAEASNYAILIDTGSIQDLAGNPFGGIISDATWNFVTGVSSVGLVFFDDFEVSSGSPDVDASGSAGNTSKQTGTNWVRSTAAFGSGRHGIVDESSGQFTDPGGEQAYAFRYTNSGLTTAAGKIGTLTSGKTYRVTFNVVGDGYNNGGPYEVGLVTFAPAAARTDVTSVASGTSMVLASKSGNYTGSAYQLVSFDYVSNGVADAAVQGHDLAIRLDGATTSANIDNVQITINDSPSDVMPPTLASSDIVDDQGGASVITNTLVTYTMTFSEDMDAAAVNAADFGNAGTSAVTIGSIAETSPGVFTVEATPTSAGSLQLQVNAGAVITDVAGNELDTTAAITDDTTISVVVVNYAPVWTVDPINEIDADEEVAYSATLADDASDANGDPLTFVKVSGPAWLIVASDGALSGTPSNSDVGANAFTVSVTDSNSAAVEAVLNITVVNVNDAPVWISSPVNKVAGAVDSAYNSTLADDAADVDGGAVLTFAKVSGAAWLNVAANGVLTGTPTSGDLGGNVFTVSVSDSIAAPVQVDVNIWVNNVNNVPVFTVDPFSASDATEDAAYAGTIAGSATDADSDPLAYAKVGGPAWLNVATDGTLSGTPANGDVGANAFTVSVSDGIASPVEATLNTTVINTNDAPVFVAAPIIGSNATETVAYISSIADSASDDDGDPLTYAKVSGPAWLSVAANGDLTGTPTNVDLGMNMFTVSVSDSIAVAVEANLEITVNSAPADGLAFADDFEPGANPFGGTTQDVSSYTVANTSTQTNTTLWVRSTDGYGAGRSGLVDESENSGLNFTDPTGTQAYGFRYTNSGVTTTEGMIGAMVSGIKIDVSIDVVADGFNGGSNYDAALVLFDAGATRSNVSSAEKHTAAVLARTVGSVPNDGNYHTINFSYTVGDNVVDNDGDGGVVDSAFLAALLGKDIALRIDGAGSHAIIDNVLVTISTPPTLASSDIVDDAAGGPVVENTLVNYTVSFSEDIDEATVDAADFGNAGTAPVTIGAIIETSPGVFSVEVTPTATGSLQLQVNAAAAIADTAGNPLDTTAAIADDTTITVDTPYSAWATNTSATGGTSDNADGDDFTNLQEFAFGMDPNAANFDPVAFDVGGGVTAAGSPTLMNLAQSGQADDERAVFTRLKNHAAAGLTYTVQFSADLEMWTASGVTPTVLTDPSSAGDLEVVSVPFSDTVPVLSGGNQRPSKFMRVVISK